MNVLDVVRAISFVEVVKDAPGDIAMRLTFADRDAKLTWSPAPAPERGVVDVRFEGALPNAEHAATISLRPQRGVARTVEAAVGEIHVDDAIVDDAWVIHGDEPALLVAALPELRALAAYAPTVDVAPTTLAVHAAAIEDGRAIGAVLALWHRAVFFRMGVS